MWQYYFYAAAAVYLVCGSMLINANSNFQSKLVFKAVPMAIGLPIAFAVFAHIMGWPVN